MSILRSLDAIATATGDGSIDWDATVEAAIESTEPGSLAVSADEQQGYREAVGDACEAVQAVSGIEFDPPESVDLLNRHHWIERNADTFERLLAPLDERPLQFGGLSRRANTATMATTLAVLSRRVQGQFDPFVDDSSAVTLVRPNVVRTADRLDLEYRQFYRWVVTHELTHEAEFEAAPWLREHLRTQVHTTIDRMAGGELASDAVSELDVTMTAVEGYAEAVVDRTVEGDTPDVRAAIETHRSRRGPVLAALERLFGIRRKRRQYERGKAFFDAVFAARGSSGAAAAWQGPDQLPTRTELRNPKQWLARVDP